MRNWAYVFSQAATLFFAVFLSWSFWWVPNKAKNSNPTKNDAEIFIESWLDLQTPIPWVAIFAISYVALTIYSQRFLKTANDSKEISKSNAALTSKIRLEKQEHQQTKEAYLTSLKSALKYILSQKNTGYSTGSRVSIYRIDQVENKEFTTIYRYAGQHRYDNFGRTAISCDEGIIGLAWATAGLRSFKSEYNPTSEEFKTELSKKLEKEELSLPPDDLRMPSRHIVAQAILDVTSRTVVWLFLKQFRFECVPVFHGLQGRLAA